MPQKTGEETASTPGGANVAITKKTKQIQFRRTWVDRYALRALENAQRQQPEECWLCEADQRAEVRRRTGVSIAPQVCPPMLRWQHHARMRCHTFASGSSPDNTASNRELGHTTPKECGCDTEPTTLQMMLPPAASPLKRKSAVSMRSSEAADHFFVTVNQLQKKSAR